MSQHVETNPAIDRFLEQHRCITALPESSIQILKALQDPNFGMEELIKLVKRDAGIVARIIKTANSAAYAKANRITEVDRAANYLGLKAVKEIVVASSVGTVSKPVNVGKYAGRDLWNHSLGVAVLARELAVRSKTIDPELAFLAGILHDIGLLLFAQCETQTSEEVFSDAEDRKIAFTEVEKTYFGFNHCELGNRLAAAWRFPEEVSAVIKWHHSPQEAPAAFKPLCMHVFVADTLCVESGVGFPLTCALQTVSDQTLADVGLVRDGTDEIVKRLKMLLRLHLN